jgi:putative oxidoreductase
MPQVDLKSPASATSKSGNIIAWVLAVLLAVFFAYVGMAKLISVRGMVQEFAQIGFGQWLRYLTGVLEVSGGIGLLIPKFSFWATLQISAVMLGATIVNLAILHMPGLAGLTAVMLALTLTLAWLRRAQSAS